MENAAEKNDLSQKSVTDKDSVAAAMRLISSAVSDFRGDDSDLAGRGGGESFNGGTFRMMSSIEYECVCGYDDVVDKLLDDNPHKPDCLQSDPLLGEMLTSKTKEDSDEIFLKLAEKHNVPQSGASCLLCTCGVDKKLTPHLSSVSHLDACPVDKPNFLHKPSGFSCEWYKHANRGLETNFSISVGELNKIVIECLGELV